MAGSSAHVVGCVVEADGHALRWKRMDGGEDGLRAVDQAGRRSRRHHTARQQRTVVHQAQSCQAEWKDLFFLCLFVLLCFLFFLNPNSFSPNLIDKTKVKLKSLVKNKKK